VLRLFATDFIVFFLLLHVKFVIQVFTVRIDSELKIVVGVVRVAVRLVFVEISGSNHDRVGQFIPRFKQRPGSSLSIARMPAIVCIETSPFSAPL
jgi:hypothetical protein